MKTMPLTLKALVTLFALCLFGGCSAYKLGSPAEPPFRALYIRPADNDSFAPQAQAIVSAQLREAFIRDGRIKLAASEAAADAVLTVNLTVYNKQIGARNSDDTLLASSFDLSLGSTISLYDQNKGEYLFKNRMIQDNTTTYVENPYADPGALNTQTHIQSEYQATALLARGLARKIADEVLSPW